ncbi:MAG TPA: LapA family protein [Gammaproteobacteria bacterium]|nr:LapA family protein [Gammaproteobacteria bacterium]
MLRLIKLIFLLAVFMIGVAFTLLNSHTVEINYYFGTLSVPLSLLIVLAVALGAVLGLVVYLMKMAGARRKISKLRKSVNNSEKEQALAEDMVLRDSF